MASDYIILHKKSDSEIFYKLSMVCAIYIAINSIFPPMRIIPNELTFIAMFLWFLFAYFASPSKILEMNIYKIVAYIFIIYTFLFPYLFNNETISHRYLDFAQLPYFYLMYVFNRDTDNEKANSLILKLSIPFIIFTTIRTIIGLLSSPYLSRTIKSTGEYSLEISKQGIGGYGLVFFWLFLCIALFYLIINSKYFSINYKNKLLYITIFSLGFILIVLSNYFTALALITLCIILIILLYYIKKKNVLNITILVALFLLFIIYGQDIFVYILNRLIEIMKPGKNLDRLLLLRQEIISDASISLFNERFENLQQSFQAFINYPIFGIVTSQINTYNGYLVGFGQHSQVLDTFALYGFGIGFLLLFMLITPFLYRLNKYTKCNDIVLLLCFCMLIHFTIDTATSSLGFAIYFVFPYIYDNYFVKTGLKK